MELEIAEPADGAWLVVEPVSIELLACDEPVGDDADGLIVIETWSGFPDACACCISSRAAIRTWSFFVPSLLFRNRLLPCHK